MNPNGQPQPPQEACIKLEILFFPQRPNNNIVVNGPINDLPSCFVLLGMGKRALDKHWAKLDAGEGESKILPVSGLMGMRGP
jgi:hypothetical protein